MQHLVRSDSVEGSFVVEVVLEGANVDLGWSLGGREVASVERK